MIDLRPVGYVIGLLVASLGVTMLGPLAIDLWDQNGEWPVFLESAIITILAGVLTSMACSNGVSERLSLRQTFLLTTLVWLTLPIFGAIPFVFGATEATFTDAFFEAMSGLTTTGATTFVGLDGLPRGLQLWRGILQWLGGVGIIVVAMVFLPELRVGGIHFGASTHYVAIFFMLLAAVPFVRFVQLLAGSAQPLWHDPQIRGFLTLIMICVLLITSWVWGRAGELTETAFRESLFNVTSIMSGTGYANADYMTWGTFPVVMFFFIGLVGGCAGSTSCSVKIFRYQLLFASIKSQIRQIHSPHGVFTPRYDGKTVSEDVLNSVMAFFVAFLLLLGGVAVLLGMTGLDFITSVSGAAAAIANIGPGLGTEIGPTGNYAGLNDAAKWILAIAMFVGRLEIMVVLAILTTKFWRT